MKKYIKTLFSPRKLIIWIFFIIIIFTIPEITRPSMSQTDALVTLLSIDRVDDEIQVATNIISPAKTNSNIYQTFTASGQTLGEAIETLGISIGKNVVFSQCEVIAFGENICEEGIMGCLDYMTRIKKVSRNSILINFVGEPKEFNETLSQITTNKQLKLENMINYNKRFLLSKDSTIELFYKNYYSDITLGVLPLLKLDSADDLNAVEVSGMIGDNSQPMTNNQMPNETKKLINDGSVSIFKKGRKILTLNPETTKKIGIFSMLGYENVVKVEHVTDEMYNDATILFNISKGKTSLKSKFVDGKPKVKFETTATVFIEQIDEDTPDKKFLTRTREFLTKEAVDALKQELISDMTDAIEYCKETGLDMINVYRDLYRFHYKDFSKYLEAYGIDHFLEGIDFEIKVNIESTY